MKSYENININAENIASAISASINNKMPSILSLLKWTEENFGINIEILYSEKSLAKIHCSGLVHFEPSINGYRVWINSKDFKFRQNFTLCHEIGHIIRNLSLKHGFSTGNIYSKWGLERFCDRFAAAYLMPADMFIYKWKTIKEPELFKKTRLANFFKVSGEAVYYRAKELKLIK